MMITQQACRQHCVSLHRHTSLWGFAHQLLTDATRHSWLTVRQLKIKRAAIFKLFQSQLLQDRQTAPRAATTLPQLVLTVLTGKRRRQTAPGAPLTPAGSRSRGEAVTARGGAAGPGRARSQKKRRLPLTASLTRRPRLPPEPRLARASPSATRGRGERSPPQRPGSAAGSTPPASALWPEPCTRRADWLSLASVLACPLDDWLRQRGGPGGRASAVCGKEGAMAAVAQCVRGALRPRYPLLSFALRWGSCRAVPPGRGLVWRDRLGPGPHSPPCYRRARPTAGPNPDALGCFTPCDQPSCSALGSPFW